VRRRHLGVHPLPAAAQDGHRMKVHGPNPQPHQPCSRVRASSRCVPRLPKTPMAVPNITVCQEESPILAHTPQRPSPATHPQRPSNLSLTTSPRKTHGRTKPIKDRPPRCGLVHCAVCSISRRSTLGYTPAFFRRETEQTFSLTAVSVSRVDRFFGQYSWYPSLSWSVIRRRRAPRADQGPWLIPRSGNAPPGRVCRVVSS
jgi:hypothetical protein